VYDTPDDDVDTALAAGVAKAAEAIDSGGGSSCP
jgi:anthranilate phosphoribosyltransferase